MKISQVTYDMAEPASTINIIKYLFSNGRYGCLFTRKPTMFNKYWAELDGRCTVGAPRHINCRTVQQPSTKDTKVNKKL